MRKNFDEALTIGQKSYTAAELNLDDVGRWLSDQPCFNTFSLYDPAIGKADEADICQIDYSRWRQIYDRGVHDSSRVVHWSTEASTGKLLVGPTPDKAYRIAGEYRSIAQELTADTDIPDMPEQYHRVIIAEAIRLLSKSDEAYQAMMVEDQEYTRQRNALVREQTPEITIGDGPLA